MKTHDVGPALAGCNACGWCFPMFAGRVWAARQQRFSGSVCRPGAGGVVIAPRCPPPSYRAPRRRADGRLLFAANSDIPYKKAIVGDLRDRIVPAATRPMSTITVRSCRGHLRQEGKRPVNGLHRPTRSSPPRRLGPVFPPDGAAAGSNFERPEQAD